MLNGRRKCLKGGEMLMAIGLDGRDRKAIQVGEYPSTEMSCQ